MEYTDRQHMIVTRLTGADAPPGICPVMDPHWPDGLALDSDCHPVSGDAPSLQRQPARERFIAARGTNYLAINGPTGIQESGWKTAPSQKRSSFMAMGSGDVSSIQAEPCAPSAFESVLGTGTPVPASARR